MFQPCLGWLFMYVCVYIYIYIFCLFIYFFPGVEPTRQMFFPPKEWDSPPLEALSLARGSTPQCRCPIPRRVRRLAAKAPENAETCFKLGEFHVLQFSTWVWLEMIGAPQNMNGLIAKTWPILESYPILEAYTAESPMGFIPLARASTVFKRKDTHWVCPKLVQLKQILMFRRLIF